MSSKSPEEKVEFLLKFLATCADIKPDYNKLHVAMGINTQSNAQRQFKAIVEAEKKYTLDSSRGQMRVIDNNGGSVPAAKPAKVRKRTKKEAATDDDDDREEEKPSKQARKSRSQKNVVKSDDGDDEDDEEE